MSGNVRSAIKALILANEYFEMEAYCPWRVFLAPQFWGRFIFLRSGAAAAADAFHDPMRQNIYLVIEFLELRRAVVSALLAQK